MNILNIAGYKFTALNDLASLRERFLTLLQTLGIKGTILLSAEGININLAGPDNAVRKFLSELRADKQFSDMSFHETFSATLPFQRLKVKIKKEIITMRQPAVNVVAQPAHGISPLELKQWLDEQRDFILLDARNDFEIEFGTFANAVSLHIKDFCEFAEKSASLNTDKPIVMFCTGGIRCEKAAIHMRNQGHKEVYQLDGGILGYFAEAGSAHYHGDCFVFDERITITPELKTAN